MSLRINTNVAALNAYGNLQANQAKQANAFEKLSSGLRINKAADDAAGLSISQGLTSQINGLTQAVSNAQDGVNVAQIADGALGTSQQVLQRMRTLVVQASNAGSNDDNSRTAIQHELGSLSTQLNTIADQTAFGGTKLLDGNYNGNFQVGANGDQTINLDLKTGGATAGAGTFSASGLGVGAASSGGSGSGATLDVTASGFGTVGDTASSGALSAIDTAITNVSKARSGIGATQNQFGYTMTNLQTSIQNVSASRSNITDADLATEVTAMTQAQILTQAATSVLAQANSAPQAILKLLQ
jgi:flagellin